MSEVLRASIVFESPTLRFESSVKTSSQSNTWEAMSLLTFFIRVVALLAWSSMTSFQGSDRVARNVGKYSPLGPVSDIPQRSSLIRRTFKRDSPCDSDNFTHADLHRSFTSFNKIDV